MRRPTEDRYLMSQSELESKIMVLLGGRASEEFFYHDLSTGAADDLDRVTELARSMIMQYGMGKNLGILTYEKMESPYLGLGLIKTHDFSEETAIKIDREINELVDHCYHLTLEKVAHHRNFIEEGVKRLLIQESLNENDLLELKREFFPSMGKNTNPVVSIPHDKTH